MYNRRNVIIMMDHMGVLREKEQTRENTRKWDGK